MKRTWKLILTIAVLAVVISCEDIEPTPQFPISDSQFSVLSSVASVAVAAQDSLSEAVSLTWMDPEYAVGLGRSKFTVTVGATGNNFASFSSKEFSGVLKGALLSKELNAMALKAGGVIGQPVTLDVKVVASQGNNNEQKNSNIVQITVTPYGDLTLSAFPVSVIATSANSSEVGTTLNWNTAFSGYSGVKMYELQYAKGGTDFAEPSVLGVTLLSKTFTKLELNKIALGFGVAAGEEGSVDFRIKATNESGTLLYSNTATVSIKTYVAYNSIGLIGDATGSWSVDADMYRPNADKLTEWTVTLYLIGGKEVKFRADDDWATNWGSADFPSGTGTQGGANIPVPSSGYYKVNLDVTSGAYSLTQVAIPAYTSISLIGPATPLGWGGDTQLIKDPTNDKVWTGTVTLTAGELKFRANNDWAANWGKGTNTTSLSGYGVNNGDNLAIEAGTYFVYINVATGEYFFGKTDRNLAYSDVGVVGSATPGGWGTDTNLIRNPINPFKWSGKMTLTEGESKFRSDNDWAINWGSASFPSGVGTQNGANMPTAAGTYQITLNTATGEYTFTK